MLDYVKFLCDLIAIDTTVPPGRNYEKAIDYLEPFFRQAGLVTEKVPIPPAQSEGNDNRFALLAHRRNAGRPRLIFYAHIDVVPAEGWDAFTPRVADGKIYGRGAADMKGSLVALLMALEKVKEATLFYDTSVMVTTDEETGQADQIRYLGQFLQPVKGAYFWDLDSSFGYVVVASLGAIQMDVRVGGRSVHSALANLGVNAVEKSAGLLNALLALKEQVTQRRSAVPAHPETGLEFMVPRLNINMIQGGIKVNIVPDQCTLSIDRRLIPEENIAAAEREIMAALNSVKDVDWAVARVFRIPTVAPLYEDPVTDKLSLLIRAVTGRTGRYGEMGSGDFGPIASNEWHARHFGLGVIRSDENFHGRNEFVRVKDIEDLAVIIERFLTSP